MSARRDHDHGPVRGELLAELAGRQGVLAAINLVLALLFAWGLASAAPAPVVAGWLGYMGITQAARLLCWHRYVTRRLPGDTALWLVATSASAGVGWGLIGILFVGLGSAAQQMLVPFFLAGMTAGAVTSLSGHLPVLHAFLAPALLPYAVRLAMSNEPAARTMAVTTLAYAAGLSIVAYQVHRSLRRLVELHLENARLIADLEQAQHGLERLLERRGAELDAVMETVPVAVWLVHDPDACRITGNHRAAQMLRLDPGGNLSLTAPEGHRQRRFRVLRDGEEARPEDLPLQRAARGEPVNGQEIRVAFDDGALLDMLISAAPVRDSLGKPAGAVGAAVDITERKRTEERIKHLAHHDALTGLPNRILLQDRLRQGLGFARRGGSGIGVLLLDLDCFKDLNDTLGHPAGDRLLRAAAERLAAVVRLGETLARLGGDEFAVVQPGLTVPDDAAALAQRLIDTLLPPFTLESQEVHMSASVGVAVSPGGSEHPDELIRQADVALYRAKQDGRGRFRLFEPEMDAEVRARRRLEGELRGALERGEFALCYQPQLDLRTQCVDTVEALVRWQHPERGLVSPGEFIPAAEASGLIRPLGAWVLGEACREAKAWRDAGLEIVVAVNLSPVQLRHDGVMHDIEGALRASGLDPRWLELEITESLLVERSEGATDRNLRGLASRSIRLALDDFGTGYSSLASLTRLPVATIKIDRSFVHDIGRDPENEAVVVRAIVSLGHVLGKRVVAEGVESEAQLAFLRQVGCDAAQGFLLGHPQVAAEVGHLLGASRRPPSLLPVRRPSEADSRAA
jgi:diguanylate cyclase (GGDEF)-like protein